jgi:hypothetical protein
MQIKYFAVALSFLSLWIAFAFIFPIAGQVVGMAIGGWYIGGWCSDLAKYLLEDKKN